ncbi:hypothetical protein ABZ499_32790 [Streptomyces sp. NPDC019990]|uniref:hypothetical protein n=1 Tax=Streptomyces sp. NPDC019990 TaxID=3154693 RepID=UPI0033EAC072
MSATPTTLTARYQAKKDRGGWYVEDTHTGQMWPGLTGMGARQVADHFNRKAA